MIHTQYEEDLSSQMNDEALVIRASVAFLEKQINAKLALFDEARNNGFSADAILLEGQIMSLLKKIDRENSNIDQFMSRYTKTITNEKKAILSGVK